jgi:hypothetical protein
VWGLTNPHRKKVICYGMYQSALDLDFCKTVVEILFTLLICMNVVNFAIVVIIITIIIFFLSSS